MVSTDPGSNGRVVRGLLLVAVGYYLLSSVLLYLGAALSWLGRGGHGSLDDAYQRVVGYQVPEGVAIADLALASSIVLVLVVGRVVNGMDPRWLVSVRPGMRWGFLAACVGIGFVVLNAVYLLGRHGEAWTFAPPSHVWLWMLLVVVTSPLQAAGEEFLFRGYLQQALGALTRHSWPAILGSAVVFAVMHGSQNLPLFIDRFGFGVVAGLVVWLTGGLEASIAVHAANNVSSFGYALAAGTIAQTRSITQSSWTTTLANVFSYALAGALAVLLARLRGSRTRTPRASV